MWCPLKATVTTGSELFTVLGLLRDSADPVAWKRESHRNVTAPEISSGFFSTGKFRGIRLPLRRIGLGAGFRYHWGFKPMHKERQSHVAGLSTEDGTLGVLFRRSAAR